MLSLCIPLVQFNGVRGFFINLVHDEYHFFQVAHAVKDGCIRLLVFSRQLIATGAEITIPFEFPIETYPGFVECACKDPLCVISKHNQQYLPTSGRKRSRYSVTDPNSSTRNSASENQVRATVFIIHSLFIITRFIPSLVNLASLENKPFLRNFRENLE